MNSPNQFLGNTEGNGAGCDTHKQAGPDRCCHGNGAVESETREGNGGEDAGHCS